MIEIKRIINYSTGALLALTLLSGLLLSSPFALADNSATNDITINVPISCNLSSSTTTNHTATVDAGTYRSEIGESTITATCNDAGGFAIYAIGYGNDTHGNNTLTHTTNPDFSIVSGTATSGATSNWAMKLTAVEGTYSLTIEGGFGSYSTVPTSYTKVASRDSSTDTVSGASIKSTYAAYIAPTQYAGTYEGKVKYTLVHPNIDAAALQMQNVSEWGATVEPGQTVYAVDTRDNEIYSVTKLADGNLWMTQNLRLNLETANITAENTNRPSEAFLAAIENEPAANNDATTWCNEATTNCLDQIQYSTINLGDTTKDSDGHTYDEYGVYYNWYTATAGSLTHEMTSMAASGDICPSGWHLPTAGSQFSDIGVLSISLGGTYSRMNASTNPTGAWMSAVLRSVPNNFVYSGRILNSGLSERGIAATYWSSNLLSADKERAYLLGLNDTTVVPGTAANSRTVGTTIRCIAHDINMKDTLLEPGGIVNAKMKSLAAGEAKTIYNQTNDIKAIRTADSLPNGFIPTEANTISTSYSQYPVYIFFDNTNNAGIMYVYSGGHQVTTNKDSRVMFANNTGLVSAEAIEDWDTSLAESMVSMFEVTSSLTSLDLSGWDTSNVKETYFMFNMASSLTSLDVSGWDTSNVTDMHAMFKDTAITSLNLSGWNTSSVSDMEYMFSSTALTSLDLSGWDTSNVTNMRGMFSRTTSLTTLNTTGWDTSKVTDMSSMFAVSSDSYVGDGQLEEIIGIEDWDVSNVTDMTTMFYGAGKLVSLNIADWNVGKVQSFSHMFCDNKKLNSLNLSGWNVSSVKTMNNMFDDAKSLTTIGDVSHWNTSSLIDLGGWLNGATSFVGNNGTLDLSGWNTSNLKSAEEMFRATKLETIDLSSWTFDSITNDAWEGAGEGIYYEYSTGLDRMFQTTSLLNTVYLSQTGLNSYNAAVARGVDITNMWSGSNISGFTVKP